MTDHDDRSAEQNGLGSPGERPLLSVIVPVFNQAGAIVENVRTIADRIGSRYEAPLEVIVVSDGSVDATQERLLAHRDHRIRVFHYDRNLGKGYAIKVGALEARGDWIGYVDADLDLDPARLPEFLAVAQAENLDIVIGSKRHPDSLVHYPRSRRVGSFVYQQVVALLFRLDVKDTQVGMKVFRRAIAEEVIPLLLVKRYAFDLELLAVANAFGFDRIREMPITLDYRFTGSGVRSLAVFRALVDTAAVFYRLRILKYYERRRDAFGRYAWTRPRDFRPEVTVATLDRAATRNLDYPGMSVVSLKSDSSQARHEAALAANTDLIAFIGKGATPAANWLSATVPFLARREVAAVVSSSVARHEGPLRYRLAAAVQESRAGGGSLYFRFTPGNLRFVTTFPADTVVGRRDSFVALGEETPLAQVCEHLAKAGEAVIYTPETFVTAAPPPLIRPHLRRMASYGRSRGSEIRRNGLSAARWSSYLALILAVVALAGVTAWLGEGSLGRTVVLVVAVFYGLSLAFAASAGGLRFRSAAVALLMPFVIVATHVVYGGALVRGLVERP